MSRRFTRGFTLIELLVVIAIIGVLASVVLVSLQSARKKGNDSRVMSGVQQIRIALEANYGANNDYPDLVSTTRIARYPTGSMSANEETLIADIISQQSAGGLAGTVRYGGTDVAAPVWQDGSVIITKDTTNPATGYAIYAKLPSGGTFCIDYKGNTKPNNATYPTSAAILAGWADPTICN